MCQEFRVICESQTWGQFLNVVSCKGIANERTTIASLFAFNQFLKGCKLKGTGSRLKIAHGMRENLISDSGVVSSVILNSPNGSETNCLALWNFLSNLLLSAVQNQAVQLEFLALTETTTVIQGFQKLINQPFFKVDQITALGLVQPQPNQPSLSAPPNQWTLALKFNASGDINFIPGGPGNLDFDTEDRIWIANNVRQGTPNSSSFCVVLNSDGSPADISPITGAGLLGCGFGVTASPDRKTMAFGNFGWGSKDYNPQVGSVSVFKTCGHREFQLKEGLSRVQGLIYDPHGNLWCTSWGTQDPLGIPASSTFDFPDSNSAVVVYPYPVGKKSPVIFEFPSPYFGTFDIAIGPDGCGYISNAGSAIQAVNSSVYKLKLTGYQLTEVARIEYDQPFALRQILVSGNEVLVASVFADEVFRLTLDLFPLSSITGPLKGPWGIVKDSQGTLFSANFFREELPLGPFGVGYIPTQGQSGLLTLPSGGEPVTLNNGFPLFGSNAIQSFDPLMRQTAVNIDRAGNLWALNNWKPRLAVDLTQNPGGDGFVAFLGLAAPRKD